METGQQEEYGGSGKPWTVRKTVDFGDDANNVKHKQNLRAII